MSIDGRVGIARWEGPHCRIDILPRLERDGQWSSTGQDSMLILDCTWEPTFGLPIWGNSGHLIIEAIPHRHYERVSGVELREGVCKA